ncbi:GNAT family N-acetyltransferase [Rhizobium paknamense]|uniref:Ribosomal protein S18 acetylase RimI-like enzyme n=1 Tax=Rhizobium paknamense TaxID=1206817 RepID=A0ABU0IE39_9HYPH|nr:GNAT family N-acetyltransferase [Rhizobium paknamense]MDQ0456513.1 ribosomal protein S18 acetylase RimI-like enzyme [Rhizobium paknamense]
MVLIERISQDANLPQVRRLEAVSFRAWPAASVHYDGSWQIRLTGGYPSKRGNCVVALDRSDISDIRLRLEKAARKFESYGRPMIFRETPLAAPQIIESLKEDGWQRFEESLVMTLDLAALDGHDGMDHLPSHDIGRFVDASLTLHGEDPALKPGLAELIGNIKPPYGLFLKEVPGNGPVAAAICVQDNDLAGLLQLVVDGAHRGQGEGFEMTYAALRWARMRGARLAWLQVVASNTAGLALYRKLGFREAYRYCYWRPEAQ